MSLRSQVMNSACRMLSSYGNCCGWFTKLMSYFFSENRYLLILTENYAALPIMQQHLLKTADDAVVIFGSSFPNDQEYTQVNCTTADPP